MMCALRRLERYSGGLVQYTRGEQQEKQTSRTARQRRPVMLTLLLSSLFSPLGK